MPLVYELILTAGDEIDLIWRRTPTAASVIFVMNRISSVLIALSVALKSINSVRQCPRFEILLAHRRLVVSSSNVDTATREVQQTCHRCPRILGYQIVQEVLPIAVAACTSSERSRAMAGLLTKSLVFSSMRVYAICDRSISLASLVGVLGVVPIATNIVRHVSALRLVHGADRTR